MLLRRYPEPDGKSTGIGVYSDSLESAFQSFNINYGKICFKLNTHEGYLKSLIYGFIRPFIEILGSDADLYHATDELCCLYLPFAKGKRITTFHHMSRGNEGRTPLLYIVWRLAAKMAVKYSDAIIAVSEQTKKELIDIMGVEEEKIHVIMHGANPYFSDLGMSRKKIIGFVGTLIERKNLAGGLRAFKIFTEMPGTEDYRYVICGEGPLKGDLVRLADELLISDRVDFISNLRKEELLEFYNTISVFANSSMHEGLGLTALEAQACGAPVVFFKNANIPLEVTKDFIPSESEYDFAKKMHELISEPDKRQAFKNSEKKQLECFETVIELYDELQFETNNEKT
jgi:glycosyltransferase involved in cell wall biosynthesis